MQNMQHYTKTLIVPFLASPPLSLSHMEQSLQLGLTTPIAAMIGATVSERHKDWSTSLLQAIFLALTLTMQRLTTLPMILLIPVHLLPCRVRWYGRTICHLIFEFGVHHKW